MRGVDAPHGQWHAFVARERNEGRVWRGDARRSRGDAGMRAALFQSARTQGSACFGRGYTEDPPPYRDTLTPHHPHPRAGHWPGVQGVGEARTGPGGRSRTHPRAHIPHAPLQPLAAPGGQPGRRGHHHQGPQQQRPPAADASTLGRGRGRGRHVPADRLRGVGEQSGRRAVEKAVAWLAAQGARQPHAGGLF